MAKPAPKSKPTAKKTAAKKTPAKKTPAKKTPANKAPANKAPANKAPAKKAPAKKAPAKKAPAKKAPANKAPAKKPAATSSARAAALHRQAAYHNWDDGVRRLGQILRDPDCDLGTALMIYWMGVPGFDRAYITVKEAPDWRRPVTKFLRELEARILARDFATASILFNPRFDRTTVNHHGHDWAAEYGNAEVRRPIPAELLEPSTPDPEWEARGRAPAEGPSQRLT